MKYVDVPGKVSHFDEDPGVSVQKFQLKHHTKDNFIIHSSNPLKTILILIVHLKVIEQRFP